jgi:predicted ester cyclase
MLEVDDIFGTGDRVVTRFRISGTHQGELMGAAPTGRRVEFGGIAVDVMRDGRRTEGWAQLDLLGLLNQLGALDRPGG